MQASYTYGWLQNHSRIQKWNRPDHISGGGKMDMKRIFLSALIGVAMVALIFPLFSGSSAALTPQSYPLVCRGGGSLVRHGEVGIGLVIGTPPVERDIGFVFTRG